MYVELFFLDNFVMNLLIIRFAACTIGTKPVFAHMCIVSFVGAVFAAYAVMYPVLMSLPFKLLLCAMMALPLNTKSVAGFSMSMLGVLFATFGIGGVASFIAFCMGGNINGGMMIAPLPYRALLYFVLVASLAPNVFRRLQKRRISRSNKLLLVYTYHGISYNVPAICDSGNMLTDPLSALPVIVIPNACDICDVAKRPIPYSDVTGDGIMYAFLPDSIKLCDTEIEALLAPANSSLEYALVPCCALPYVTSNENNC